MHTRIHLLQMTNLHGNFNAVRIGGGAKCPPPLKAFAEYLKNASTNFHQAHVTSYAIIKLKNQRQVIPCHADQLIVEFLARKI